MVDSTSKLKKVHITKWYKVSMIFKSTIEPYNVYQLVCERSEPPKIKKHKTSEDRRETSKGKIISAAINKITDIDLKSPNPVVYSPVVDEIIFNIEDFNDKDQIFSAINLIFAHPQTFEMLATKQTLFNSRLPRPTKGSHTSHIYNPSRKKDK